MKSNKADKRTIQNNLLQRVTIIGYKEEKITLRNFVYVYIQDQTYTIIHGAHMMISKQRPTIIIEAVTSVVLISLRNRRLLVSSKNTPLK